MSNVDLKSLLQARVHMGHQTRRWNPRSKPYIFDHRQGVSIIDLGKTYEALQQACDFVENLVADGRVVLLVGTKRQAQEIVREKAVSHADLKVGMVLSRDLLSREGVLLLSADFILDLRLIKQIQDYARRENHAIPIYIRTDKR